MTKFKHAKRKLSLLFVFMLVVNMISSNILGNTSSIKAASLPEEFWLTSVAMEKDGAVIPWDQPIEIAENTRISLFLAWEIANGAPIADGVQKTVQIPDIFIPVGGTAGSMMMMIEGNKEEIGTYLIDSNNLLTLTFNDMLKTGGDYEEDRKGD